MATRKIKDAKDLSTNDLIYFKGHAKATYMSDGTTVEDAINNLETRGVDLSEYPKKTELAIVATSGRYEDLLNKPTIPPVVVIDSSMSTTSTNPVQNKVVKSYIDSNCNIPVSTTTSTSISLSPNRYYRWTNTPSSITITLATPSNSTILNNYMFEFTASSSGTTLTMPSTIKWLNGSTPTIDNGKTYQISIINNLATISKFG